MSILQDLVVVFCPESREYMDEGVVRSVTTNIPVAQWLVNSEEDVVFPAWVRHGIETKGWGYERRSGHHILLDYNPGEEGLKDMIEMMPQAPDFTPE